jgi:hypothetical protein
VQANSDPLPLPHGENLEVSGSISTGYFWSADTGGSSMFLALISSKQWHPSLGRTQSWYTRMEPLQAQWTRHDTCVEAHMAGAALGCAGSVLGPSSEAIKG